MIAVTSAAHSEVKQALADGKTIALIFSGGTERDKGWVRKELIATAVGDPVLKPGEKLDANAPRVGNGITGDARRSTPEIGKVVTEFKVLNMGAQTAEK